MPYKDDPDGRRKREYNQAYYRANREKLKEAGRRYREANPEDSEKLLARTRRYREINREQIRDRAKGHSRRYREANREKVRERDREASRRYREAKPRGFPALAEGES